MCGSSRPRDAARHPNGPRTPAFTCQRLNRTTFVLEEDDKWGENPLIYAKLFPHTIVLIDTGCGGATQTPGIEGTLKTYLETVPVADNHDEPLNPGGLRTYTLICSHCHYDHIGGIPEFVGTDGLSIWASALGKDLIQDAKHFPISSLCSYVGMGVPVYQVTDWADDGQVVTNSDGTNLHLAIYQAPGHTPDELAVWDPEERFLYVGDTTYENGPTLFPNGGSVLQYRASIEKLLQHVKGWNAEGGERVKIACGHNTKGADAESLLEEVSSFLGCVMRSETRGIDQTEEKYAWAGGEPVLEFRQEQRSKHGVYFQGLKTIFEEAGVGR